jgi:hypothetical protein
METYALPRLKVKKEGKFKNRTGQQELVFSYNWLQFSKT